MTKTHCEICNRNFKNEEALEMHNRAKHAPEEKKQKSVPVNTKKIKSWTIFLIIILVIVGLIWWAFSSTFENESSCRTDPAETINIGGHANLAMHIHPFLQIIINGQQQTIPANVGISPGVMRPVHTHDGTGELHVEGPCRRDFVLGDLFKIWQKEFNSECIFEYCTDQGELTMTVNGQPNSEFENLILRDGDQIVIEYNSFNN